MFSMVAMALSLSLSLGAPVHSQAPPSGPTVQELTSPTQQNSTTKSPFDQAMTALREGRELDAAKLFQLAVTEAEGGGDESAQLSTALVWLAHLHRRKGEYAEAEALLDRALAVDQKSLQHYSWVLRDLSLLATFSQSQGKLADAEKYYARALQIEEADAERLQSFARIVLLSNASTFFAIHKRRYPEAERLLERAIAIHPASDDPTGAQAEGEQRQLPRVLAMYYDEEGKHDEADKLLTGQASTGSVASSKSGNFDLSPLLDDLALAGQYKEQRKLREAEELLTRLIEALDRGPQFSTAKTLSIALGELGDVYHDQGRNSEAEQTFLRGFEVWEGAAIKASAAKRTDLARQFFLPPGMLAFYREQQRLREVEPYLIRALKVQETVLGPMAAPLAATLTELGELCREERKFGEAVTTYARILEIQETNLGSDSLQLVSTLSRYAAVLREVGRTEDAAKMRARAEEIRSRSLGRPPG